MIVDEYLKRIKYNGSYEPDLNVLRNLQNAQLLNVPFENLDIHYKRHIQVDINSFYQKIVERKRGGFCYELNGLFSALLRQLGFHVNIVSARVYDPQSETYGREFDHLSIIVKLDGRDFLTDVGFGEFTQFPLSIELDVLQSDPRGDFIIQESDTEDYIVFKAEGGKLIPQYRFTAIERELHEFREMCNYHQSSPDSHFTQKKLISIMTEKGRVTISGNTLKISEHGKIIREISFPEGEFEKFAEEWFHIRDLHI